ncbi:MAG TPA: SRPBCC family protein [Methylotenera sp.]|nr:SRPBCC family protein [Methylotenera sp.]
MSKLLIALSVVALGFASHANAESLYVIKSVNINVPAAKAWDKISKFGDLGAWHPAVAKTEIVSGKDFKSGAKRELTLQDGGKINETLKAYDAKHQTMSYIITDSVLPVSNYAANLHVYPNGADKSVVVWDATFSPKAGADEKTASDTINGVFDGGLNNLKKILE